MKIDINNIGQGLVTGEGTSVNYSFAELLTIANLRKGKYRPCSRNPVLAQCLSYFHRIEERGSGFRRMREQMRVNDVLTLSLPNEMVNDVLTPSS